MFFSSAVWRRPAWVFGLVMMALLAFIVAGLEKLPVSGAPEPVRRVASWAVENGDNAGLPFVVIDKAGARLFSFDPKGVLRDSAPALLSAQASDEPGGSATPAGRFVAEPADQGLRWVNAQAAIELHTADSPRSPGRAERRLASGRTQDRRISEGSVTVPTEFFARQLAPLRHQATVAYVLPERRPLHDVFGAHGDDRVATSPRHQLDNHIWRTRS